MIPCWHPTCSLGSTKAVAPHMLTGLHSSLQVMGPLWGGPGRQHDTSQTTFSRLVFLNPLERYMKKHSEQGFTLIELLVVVAIVGILAAIAIPQFSEYRQRGADSAAKSDLRNLAVAQEAFFVENDTYAACANLAACLTAVPGIKAFSKNVTDMVVVADNDATPPSFTATATVSGGSQATWVYDSSAGGIQEPAA